jgi:hypothetical protein
LLGLLFDPENGVSIFLGNVGKLAPGDTASHFRRKDLIVTAVITYNQYHR